MRGAMTMEALTRLGLQLLRLLEAYPDGVTEAVVLTELTARLDDRVYRGDADNALGGRRIQDADALSEFLSGMEGDALSGRAIGVDRQRLCIEVDQADKLAVDMSVFRCASAGDGPLGRLLMDDDDAPGICTSAFDHALNSSASKLCLHRRTGLPSVIGVAHDVG